MLRNAELKDMKKIIKWRNDPVTRSTCNNTDKMSNSEGSLWFKNILHNPNRHMFLYKEKVVLDISINGEEAEIGINVSPSYRGKGLGTKSLIELQQFVSTLKIKKLIAYIKSENIVSIKCFLKAGFKEIENGDIKKFLYEIKGE